MRDDVVIRAESLSKKYNVPTGDPVQYVTLREALTSQVKQTWRRIASSQSRDASASQHRREFWALRDVSFEVKRGDVFGIIGRNGAGKSTLLKILSRITPPTTGRVEITGRVASLLEVGTGFHPELTGRENIFLNGSILGMRRDEIAKVFDEIVEFAEISNFVDTPVKRYSSGMYVRLAFAVAAHLDPEILILDEVLAVGDAGFQRKCAAKIDEIVRSSHRTIIVVSHGMGTITSMCNRTMLLDHGRLIEVGAPVAVVEKYLAMDSAMTATADYSGATIGDELATLIRADIQDNDGKTVGALDIGQSFEVKMIECRPTQAPCCQFPFSEQFGSDCLHKQRKR
jgi:lipopolysaccharide transport system ATP-binding protein